MPDSQRAFELLQAGDTDALRRLLEQSPAAAEARDPDGVSLLMHALYRGQRDLAELIARKKTANNKKQIDLFEAASLGHLDRLKACLDETQSSDSHNIDSHAVDSSALSSHSPDGFTALHFACFFSQPEAARLLLDRGAAANSVAANATQVMPLHSAAAVRNLEAARLLLEHGAPVNARQQAGWAPIHAAAQNGDCAMVDLLLQHHADPKQANDEGKTPAMVAREKGHEEIAALLEK